MSTSALPAVLDYLVTLFETAPTIGAASPPIPVYDGPEVTDPGMTPVALYVGVSDPGVESQAEAPVAAVHSWRWASMPLKRYETLGVWCTSLAVSGSSDIRSARIACTTLTAAVDALIVPGNVTLGDTVLYVSGMSDSTLKQGQYSTGAVAWQSFFIECEVRI